MKTNRFHVFVLAAAATLLDQAYAFDVGPDYAPPTVDAPATFQNDFAEGEAMSLSRNWWTLYDDPELAELIETALLQNQDLESAAHRVDQARALAGQARADLFPQLAIDARASRGQSLETGYRETDYANLPGVLSYEIDLWGGIRRGASAAKSAAQAEQFRYDAAWLSLSGQVAETLYLLRAAAIEEDIVARTVETRREARDVIADRHSLGSAAEFDLVRAETELANAEADLAEVSLRKRQLRNALALLVGESAPGFGDGLDEETALPQPPVVPAGLPVEVIGSRPDVAAAERTLSATADRIGVAKAAFYPSIRLTGTGGWESGDLDEVFSSDSRVWSFGPQVYLPVFQGKRNKARLAQAVAAFEEQGADFRQTALAALREVQDALDAARFLEERNAANDRAVASARRAAELSQTRYDAGYVSYLEVVDSERVALATERAQAQLRALRVLASIDLIQALGGGWRK